MLIHILNLLLVFIRLLMIALMVVQLVQMAMVWKAMDQSRPRSLELKCDRGRRNPARPRGTSTRLRGMRFLGAGARVVFRVGADACTIAFEIIITILWQY